MSNMKFTYLDKLVHELNGSIHTISFISEMMLQGKDGKVDITNLEHIHEAGSKLAKIVSLLSSITNLKSDKISISLEEFDLINLVKQEIKYHQVRNIPNRDLKINLKSKILDCKAKVDGFWFRQLLTNLITNAVNHCEKGLIEIHTGIFKKGGTDYFCLRVKDEGCGIPKNELENIFKPLERGSHSLEKNIPGSGIGLAIAKEIVEAHGGNILAKNGSKAGAIFEVLIPLKG